mgnify:CR=1 FL=1
MIYKGYEIEAFDHIFFDLDEGVKIRVNGVKFPREKGEHYATTNERKAIDWAIAEYEGKYLSRGGLVYESKAEYHAHMDAMA